MSKSPRVYTSDPERRETRLKLVVQAVNDFDSTAPLAIGMDKVVITPDKKKDIFNLKVTNISDQPVSPQMIYAPYDVVDIDLPESVGAGEIGYIKIEVADDFEWKNTKTSFTFAASETARYTIPLEVGKFSTPRPRVHKNPASAKRAPADPNSISSTRDAGDNQPLRPTEKKDDGK